jgi:predicted unusual protein kinase regulating ubiquinone biosynthesis (AarF/ABC1/UbiB family)
VSILSGICTGLDPEFNIFDHLAPFAQNLIIEESRLSPAEIVNQFGSFAQLLFSLPGKVDRTIDKLEKGEIAVRMPEIAYTVKRIDHSMRKAVWGIVFAALLLSGVQLQLAGQETFAYFLYGGSFISLLLIVFGGRRKT